MARPTRTHTHRVRTGARPHTSERRFDDKGLTLAEMVVALGIIMLVLLASLSAFIAVQHSQLTAEGTDRAIQLANDRIERIRQNEWPLIGFATPVYNAELSAAGTAIKTDYDNNYRSFTDMGTPTIEDSVTFTYPDLGSVPATLTDIKPYEYLTADRNKFSVYTTITYGKKVIDGITLPTTTNTTTSYSFKRVRVTVRWQSGGTGQWHQVVNEAWIAPKGYHQAPPGVPVNPEPAP